MWNKMAKKHIKPKQMSCLLSCFYNDEQKQPYGVAHNQLQLILRYNQD